MLARRSAGLGCLLIVGAPLRVGAGLFNCAVVLHRGRVLGVVPKSYLPGYREFYEKRQFAAARDTVVDEVQVAGQAAPFGADLVFEATDAAHLTVHVEIGGPVGADPTVQHGLAGRGDGAGEPVRLQYHGRQGRLP